MSLATLGDKQASNQDQSKQHKEIPPGKNPFHLVVIDPEKSPYAEHECYRCYGDGVFERESHK